MSTQDTDTRPRTLAIHQHYGIGDLVWHIPYFRALAQQSQHGQISVLATPSTCAKALLSCETCIEDVFEFDYRPRRSERRKGTHKGLKAQLAFAKTLRQKKFDRVFIFGDKMRFGLLAFMARIPKRYGYGFRLEERLFLNQKPYIKPFQGEGSWVYPEATAFAIAHGLVDGPIVPKMQVAPEKIKRAQALYAHLPRPIYAFAIGSSEPYKQWGASKFAVLANTLAEHGASVILLGGRAERYLAEDILRWVPEKYKNRVLPETEGSILDTAAILCCSDFLVGNDTGVLNMAAACNLPCLGLFGGTLPLLHDPILHAIQSENIGSLTPEAVWARLHELHAPGLSTNQQIFCSSADSKI